MIEILKTLREAEEQLNMPMDDWLENQNRKLKEMGMSPVEPAQYYAALCGLLSADITYMIILAERAMEEQEFMVQKLREKWEAEKEEEEND